MNLMCIPHASDLNVCIAASIYCSNLLTFFSVGVGVVVFLCVVFFVFFWGGGWLCVFLCVFFSHSETSWKARWLGPSE